jgi:hypothetical protein
MYGPALNNISSGDIFMYQFEARLPIDYTMQLVTLVRAGEIVSKKEEALILSGSIQGELGSWLKSLKNTPDPVPFATIQHHDLPANLEACADELDALLSGDAPKLNPEIVALIMQLITLAIQRWLNA